MTDYQAVVYDLDGTLVRLDVDWGAVREDCRELCRANGVEAEGVDLWSMLDRADDGGFRDELETTIASYESDGAVTSRRLELADELPLSVPVGVCSLNAERACRRALDEHSLTDHVAVVVGRDTVPAEKPAPEPLLEVLDELDVATDEAVFVGDSETDAEAARAAGVDFQWVRDRLDL